MVPLIEPPGGRPVVGVRVGAVAGFDVPLGAEVAASVGAEVA